MATVIVLGTRAPVGLELARVLHRAGHRVVGADPLAWPLTRLSRAVVENVQLPPPRFSPDEYVHALEALVQRTGAARVVPTCEEVFYAARAEVPVFAPPLPVLARLHDKGRFADRCAAHGLAVPETHRLTSDEALAPFLKDADAWVFKPAFSRFGWDAAVPPHLPARLDWLWPTPARPLVAQRFVPGPQVCAYAVAHAGRLAALAVYRTPYRAGGAGVHFAHEAHPGVRAWVEAFVAAEGITGQVSFDFIETPGGAVQAIECNPRATSGLHLLRDAPGLADVFFAPPARVLEPPPGAAFRLTLPMLAAGRRARYDAAFRRAFRTSHDVLFAPDDPGPALGQIATVATFAAIAARGRTKSSVFIVRGGFGTTLRQIAKAAAFVAARRPMNLLAASTVDIEWNGEDDGAPDEARPPLPPPDPAAP